MNFSEALEAMKAGKKIRRPHWHIEDYLDTYKMFNERRKDACFDDMLADDWEIVE